MHFHTAWRKSGTDNAAPQSPRKFERTGVDMTTSTDTELEQIFMDVLVVELGRKVYRNAVEAVIETDTIHNH